MFDVTRGRLLLLELRAGLRTAQAELGTLASAGLLSQLAPPRPPGL